METNPTAGNRTGLKQIPPIRAFQGMYDKRDRACRNGGRNKETYAGTDNAQHSNDDQIVKTVGVLKDVTDVEPHLWDREEKAGFPDSVTLPTKVESGI